jgi:hypothetical protein
MPSSAIIYDNRPEKVWQWQHDLVVIWNRHELSLLRQTDAVLRGRAAGR